MSAAAGVVRQARRAWAALAVLAVPGRNVLERAPLFWRLLAALVAVAALTGGPLLFVSYLYNKDSTEQRARQNLEQQVAILSENFLQEYRVAPARTLKQLAASDVFAQMLTGPRGEKSLNAKALETQFFGIAREHARYSSMAFLDATGREIAGIAGRARTGSMTAPSIIDNPDPSSTSSSYKRRLFNRISTTPALLTSGNMEWFMPPRDMLVEGPFLDAQGRQTMIAGLGTLDGDSGAFAGVLMIELNLDPFMELLRSVRFFDENPVWVFSGNGALMLQPSGGESSLDPRGRIPAEPALEATFLRTPEGLFAFKDLSLAGKEPALRLVYALSTDLLLKDLVAASRYFALTMLVAVFIVLVLALLISRGISRPIVQLVDAALRLSRGDLSARVRAPASGEIRVLIDSFNSMSARLQEANDSRAEAMEALRRTADLMREEAPSAMDVEGKGGLGTQVAPKNDTEDLRRITGLITQLIQERVHRVEELRRAIRSADDANRAKGDFLATMSHEIRTPLNAVIGLAEELGRSELSREQLHLVGTMESAGNQLLGIVNDILDFTRLQGGHLELNVESVHLRSLVDRQMLIIRGLPRAATLDVRHTVHPSVPDRVDMDGTRFMQILTNLLGNAVKFTERGSVTLDIGIEATKEGGQGLCVSVTDSGSGVPPELREHLFEPFRQGRAGALAPQPGTGLGLAISQKIARAMGGDIVLDTTVTSGARFVLRLPLRTRKLAPPRAGSTDPAPSSQAPLRILVAEDTPANQLVIQLLLRRLGHAVRTVPDGAEALRAFTEEPFDLVMLDIQMPVMNGLEAARAIRAQGGRGLEVPIIALTAFTQESDRQGAEDAGIDCFVSKPVRSENIVEAIREALGKRGSPAAGPT